VVRWHDGGGGSATVTLTKVAASGLVVGLVCGFVGGLLSPRRPCPPPGSLGYLGDLGDHRQAVPGSSRPLISSGRRRTHTVSRSVPAQDRIPSPA
jgi:hypothetical protein